MLLLACAVAPPPPAALPALPVEPLPGPLLLRRMSLDLRGTLPSIAELDALEADPGALPELRDAMLADPRLQERLVDLLAEQFLTRSDTFNVSAAQFGVEDDDAFTFIASIGEEPLRLAAWIAATGQPWTEVARSEYTLTNDLLLTIWPLEEAPEAGGADLSGWRPARYTDHRPPGGIVVTNGFVWRYYQAVYSRSRAAAISDLLLCDDYLERPIDFATASLLDHDGIEMATREEGLCQSCHSTLDPVAAALLGFHWFEMYDAGEVSTYHPEREGLGPYLLGVEPAWFGTPLTSVAALGDAIAQDPRFVPCAVERFASGLWRRPVDLEDRARLEALRVTFEAADLAVPALLVAVTDTDEYRAGGLAPEAPVSLEPRVATRRLLAGTQLADVIEQLTGYRWAEEGWDQLDNDVIGYRLLVGGAAPPISTTVQRDHGVTRALVIKRLGQAAASYVVEADRDATEAPRMFDLDVDAVPDAVAFDAQARTLYRRLYAEAPDDAERTEVRALWDAVAADDGPAAAWTSVLSGMLRDPRFWSY